jgi:predicted ATP-binding protein involved in virulence
MIIKKLSVENYRCFDRLAIDFDEKATIIVGPNGSGKTAILESLSVFLSLLSILSKKTGILSRSFSAQDIKKGGQDHIKYRLDLDIRSYECVITASHDGLLTVLNNDYLDLVQTIHSRRESFPIMVYYSSDRYFYLEDVRLKNDDFLVDDKQAFKNNFAPKIDYTSTLKWFKSLDIMEAKRVRDTRDVNFRVTELQAVKDVITKVLLGRYDDPRLDDSGRELIVRERATGEFFPLSQLSQGFQSILALSIDLARRMAQGNAERGTGMDSVLASPAIVLIDEIDLHLHPGWEVSLLPTLVEAFPGTQFIVTTQSVLVTGSLGPENVRILRPEGVEKVDPDFPWNDFGPILTKVFGVPRGKTGRSAS